MAKLCDLRSILTIQYPHHIYMLWILEWESKVLHKDLPSRDFSSDNSPLLVIFDVHENICIWLGSYNTHFIYLRFIMFWIIFGLIIFWKYGWLNWYCHIKMLEKLILRMKNENLDEIMSDEEIFLSIELDRENIIQKPETFHFTKPFFTK